MVDPELGITKCYYCENKRPLLTPNEEQKSFWREFEEKDVGKNIKYCYECMRRCDVKIEKRKLKRMKDSRIQKPLNSESETGSYGNDFTLEPTENLSESTISSIDHNGNESRSLDGSSVSTIRRKTPITHDSSEDSSLIITLPTEQNKPSRKFRGSKKTSPKKRPAESDDDSELELNVPQNQPAKKNKSNEQSKDNNQSRQNTQNSNYSEISAFGFDNESPPSVIVVVDDNDDDCIVIVDEGDEDFVPHHSNASGLNQSQIRKPVHITAAPPNGDDDDNSLSSSSDNSISAGRNSISSQSGRRSNLSQSNEESSHDEELAANDSVSSSAPSQKHVRYRVSPPTRPYTPEEQESLRNRDTRNATFSFSRPTGA